MKKIAFVLGTMLLLAVTNLSAQKECYPFPNERGDTLYFVVFDSTAEIISEQKAFITDTLFIPQKISYMGVDYPVTQIHANAFRGFKFNHVVIPEGITYIGQEAFANNDFFYGFFVDALFNYDIIIKDNFS